jgi:hypothetical protein
MAELLTAPPEAIYEAVALCYTGHTHRPYLLEVQPLNEADG